MNIELNANAVVNATSQIEDDINWEQAMDPDNFMSEYSRAAEAIVEPKGVEDEYYDMGESNPENWASWMSEIAGKKWGELAILVNKYGY